MKFETPHKICDSVHGFIRISDLEKKLIDSLPFQRLRYIRQMGMAYLVYPGATHTRFEHSLGVMHLADKMFLKLFEEQELTDALIYCRQILRLGALCHDLGHLPFSHVAEKTLLPNGGHEAVTEALILSETLRPIFDSLGTCAAEDVLKVALTKTRLPSDDPLCLVAKIVTDDNFGADRIDYLLRDAKATGAGYGSFDALQLIDCLRKVENPHPCIGVHISGLQSVESLWVSRYMMLSRVSHHPKVRLYSKHMASVMNRYHEQSPFTTSLEAYLKESDDTVLAEIRKRALLGDYDAQVVLMQAKPFQQIFWAQPFDAQKLQMAFPNQVWIDRPDLKKAERSFPIIADKNHIVSSDQVSAFLSTIPQGAVGPYLFAHPDYLSSIESALVQE